MPVKMLTLAGYYPGDAIAKFTARRPDVVVVPAQPQNDGSGADVAWVNSLAFTRWFQKTARPLEPLAARCGFNFDPYRPFLELHRDADGALRGLLVEWASYAIHCNLDLLARAGVELPISPTWDELLAAAHILQRRGVPVTTSDSCLGWLTAVSAWQSGADLTQIATLLPAHRAVRSLRRLSVPDQSSHKPFVRGEVALWLGDYLMSRFWCDEERRTYPFRWTLLPLPRLDPKRPPQSYHQSQVIGISSTTLHPALAFELLAFIATHRADLRPLWGHEATGVARPAGEPFGIDAVRDVAVKSDLRDWNRGAEFWGTDVFAALSEALIEGWDGDAFIERVPPAIAATPACRWDS